MRQMQTQMSDETPAQMCAGDGEASSVSHYVIASKVGDPIQYWVGGHEFSGDRNRAVEFALAEHAEAELARWAPAMRDAYVVASSPRSLQQEAQQGGSAETSHAGLPVHGYRPQPASNVDTVNINKQIEETLLRRLDDLAKREGIDQRWLAIGRTHIEQAFMAINRAVFKPERVKLPEDELYPPRVD